MNDPLSLERAESVAAFLKDEVDVWLERYSTKVTEKRRWGPDEDLLMLQSLADFFERPEEEAPVSWFQRTRGLTVDGIAGPETRRALILEYMAHDETTLPPGVSVTNHGCGEFFPLEETGQAIDPDPKNPERDAADRRVELYFFDKEFGIQPPPPGKNSSKGSYEYPEWRKRADVRHESELRLSDRMLRVRLQVDGEPIADEEYALDVDGRRVTVARTDTDGLVVQRLPVKAALAQIRVPRLGILRSIRIEPTEVFPPVTDLTGAQIRLAHLGFLNAEPTGLFDELTQDAIVAFRKERGLSAAPELDADTERELVDAYGS